MFLYMMGENEVSNACKQLAPATYEKANSMLGLFENKHGLFHSQRFLKGVQSKIVKVIKWYCFSPSKIPQLLIVNDKDKKNIWICFY